MTLVYTPAVELVVSGLEKTSQLEIQPHLSGFSYYESMYSFGVFTLSVTSPEVKEWDRVASGGYEEVLLRWGRRCVVDGEVKWQKGVGTGGEWWKVIPCDGTYHYLPGQAITVSLQGSDLGLRLRQRCGRGVWKSAKISEIVREIASANELECEVDETVGVTSAFQCDLSDADFITKRLLPHAVSTEGRRDFYFFVTGSKLYFIAPRLDVVDESCGFVSREQREMLPEIPLQRQGAYLSERGSLSTELRGFDLLRGEPIFFTADTETTGLLEGKRFPTLGEVVDSAPVYPSKVLLTSFPEPEGFVRLQVEDEAVARWSRYARGLYRISLPLLPTPDLVLGSVVEVNTGELRSVSGKYLLYGMRHRVNKEGYAVTAYLERRASGK